MQPIYRLVIKAGPNVGKQFPLEKVELFIGRDLNNDVVVNDPEISRRHARLILQGSSFLLEDLGSTNGTFIRGQRLSGPYLLVPGDMITFGERINLLFEPVAPANSAQTIQEPRRDFAPPPPPPPMAYPPASPGGYSATQIEPPASPRPAPPPMMPAPLPQQPVYQPAPPPPQPVYQPPAQPIYQQPPPAFEPYQPPQSVQPPYAGQVPMPPPAPAKKAIPAWMWVVVAILLLIIVVLVIDDFRLWYIFGLK